jgi:hypothetical protein
MPLGKWKVNASTYLEQRLTPAQRRSRADSWQIQPSCMSGLSRSIVSSPRLNGGRRARRDAEGLQAWDIQGSMNYVAPVGLEPT